jgi:catechol 2,3-dioxygenase-like lactoylglutathione lyase family enzyme
MPRGDISQHAFARLRHPGRMLKNLTPVLVVDAIEPCLAFWIERIGFEKVAEVPDGERLGFALLVRDGREVMLQTVRSVEHDLPTALAGGTPQAFLFVEVDDLAPIERAFADVTPAVAPRRTFYGMDEVGYRDPAGNLVVFARRVAE